MSDPKRLCSYCYNLVQHLGRSKSPQALVEGVENLPSLFQKLSQETKHVKLQIKSQKKNLIKRLDKIYEEIAEFYFAKFGMEAWMDLVFQVLTESVMDLYLLNKLDKDSKCIDFTKYFQIKKINQKE